MMPIPLLTPKVPEVADRRGDEAAIERLRRGQPERRSFRERRATSRLAVALSVELDDGVRRHLGSTTDLSTFGLSIRSGDALPAGLPVSVRLRLNDGRDELLMVPGVVLGPYDNLGGVRVRFLAPPVGVARRLHRFVHAA
ncbi:MAG: PilZ domain-containing protein [Archangium sp.]|nr:PilZ domain-containing protein [Archangium sp.]